MFHRVIIESGAATARAVRPYNAKIHEQQLQHLLKEEGCQKYTAKKNIITFLRSSPYETITTAQTKVFDNYNSSLRWAWQPVVDGVIISTAPLDSLESGEWHKVPVLTGFNLNEASIYFSKKASKSSKSTSFFRLLLPSFDENDITELERMYSDPLLHPYSPYNETRKEAGAPHKRLEAAYANYAYQTPARQTAEFALSTSPVYLYQCALESSILDGASHGDKCDLKCVIQV